MLGAVGLLAAVQFLVTVTDPGSGRPVTGLRIDDFAAASEVVSVEDSRLPLSVLLVLDTSVAGAVVRKAAEGWATGLGAGDQLALFGYQDAPVLIQPFRSDRRALKEALGKVSFAGDPRLWDTLAAALEQPFPAGRARKVVVLLTAGIEGANRATASDAIHRAREKGIAVYPVYLHGSGQWSFAALAAQTGGAMFWLRALTAQEVWRGIQAPYLVTLAHPAGASTLKVKGREKTLVSALPWIDP